MRLHPVVGVLIACALVFVVGCEQATPANDHTLRIGGAFALTGDGSSWGVDEQRAVQLAIDEVNAQGGINGATLSLLAEDTQSSAQGSLSAVQKLLSVDAVPVVIGPTWGDSFGAVVGPVAEQQKAVLITPSGAMEVANPTGAFQYFFSTWYPLGPELRMHLAYARSHGITRIAILHDKDPYNALSAELFTKLASEYNVTVVDSELYVDQSNDFRTPLLKIAATNPQAVFVQIFQVNEIGLLLRQSHQLGYAFTFLSTSSAQTQTLLDLYAQDARQSIVFTYPQSGGAAEKQFSAAFSAKYGVAPVGASAASAYDATRAVIAALEGGARSGETLRTALAHTSIDGTVIPHIEFDEHGGLTDARYSLREVRDGAFVTIQSEAFGELASNLTE